MTQRRAQYVGGVHRWRDKDAPDHLRFGELTYEDFQAMARDASLSHNERIGFPETYRAGVDAQILDDMRSKLPALDEQERTIVDIGAGCGGLSRAVRSHCVSRSHHLTLVDSPEMLTHHNPAERLDLLPGRFPQALENAPHLEGSCDAVIVYSVVQYAFRDASIFEFVDAACEMLAPDGRLLIGDLPNATMRKRFLASEAGLVYHRQHADAGPHPIAAFNTIERGQIDDAVVLAILSRARASGFHSYVVPQSPKLPMATRREDIVIHRP